MQSFLRIPSPYVIAYLGLWAGVLFFLRSRFEFESGEAVAGLIILALLFPALAWVTTRGITAPRPLVHAPGRESAMLLGYLWIAAFVVAFGFSAIARITAEPLHALVLLAVKLAVFVAAPAVLLIVSGGYTWRELMPCSLNRAALKAAAWMCLATLGMEAMLGRGLTDIRNAHLPPGVLAMALPACLLFLILEVGLVEEFFFRALLQERLSIAMRSSWGGLVLSSLLFGLVHAPGLYLRPGMTMESVGAHPPLLLAVGYSIVVTSVAGVFLGVLWMRTRNLALVALVHAAADFLPGIVPWTKAFHLS